MAVTMPMKQGDGVAPEELAQALESETQMQERRARLEALGQHLAKIRSEAIQGRQQSGVEQDWREDEEFYQGIDDANRAEHRSVWHTKPMGQAAAPSQAATQSTVFPNITGPYVDAAAARTADMLLPTDDRNYAISPTPIPELVGVAKGDVPQSMQDDALAMHGGDENKAVEEIAYAINEAKRLTAEAKEKGDRAQKRIEDWHVECQYHANVRTVIEDSARIGTAVLKGPVPVIRKGVAFINGQVTIKEKLNPASKRVDVWNFYPDPDCGENIQNGSYTWERDRVTRKQLRELAKQPGYIKENIEACLEEGPMIATTEATMNDDRFNSAQSTRPGGKYEIWYYHGTLEKADLEAGGCDCSDQKDAHVPAMMTMVNNRVIRASLNPLDTGSFPYDVMVWRPKANHWTGTGVARQIRVAQRIVTAATRNLMDNAGLAAGPMLVLRQGVVTPANGVVGIAPRKVYMIAEDADEMVNATNAIGTVKVEMLVNELMEIIKFGLKLAEDVTGLPLLLQGQQGKAPDTLGGMQMLNNNASSVLRRLARLFDDRVTEPHITRYYEWLLQYGEDDEKGDFQIDARGSSALVERDIQNQELAGLGKLSLDMRFGIDPRKWVKEYLMSRHFDPKRFEFEDEEWKKILQQMSQKPQDSSLQIAQLKSESAERLAAFWAEEERKAEEQRLAFTAQESEKDRELAAWLTQLEQAGTRQISLDDIKAKLADTTIKTRTQVELSREDRAHAANEKQAERVHGTRMALAAPTEPAGRAKPGKAFQQ